MRRYKRLLPALALVVILPAAARAQAPEKLWLVEASGAYVINTGTFGDLVKNGWGGGALVGYAINEFWYFLVNANVQVASAADNCATCVKTTNYSYFGMLGMNVAPSQPDWDVLLIAGAGGSTFSPEGANSNTYFALNGGVRGYYWVSPSVALSLDAMASLSFTDQQEVGTSSVWSFPLGVGVAFRF